MATGGEVPGQNPNRTGSEDLENLKCQLCLEDGNLHEAVGMCIDCSDYLCETCFNSHTRPRPLRNHQLIDKAQMLQDQVRACMKDMCTEKCEVHEDEVIKYYCTRHGLLGCTVCVTLGHTTCKDVHYIPHVAKELEGNADYKKTEQRLNSAIDTFKKINEIATQNNDELEASSADAIDCIREFRRSLEEALRNMEAEMIEAVQTIKSEKMKELAELGEKYRTTQEELQSALGKIEALQNAQKNCSVFTEMMKLKERLAALETQINEAVRYKPYQKRLIKFSPNQDTLEKLTQPDALGIVYGPVGEMKIVQAKHTLDINVKTGTDREKCSISGITVLSGDKIVIVDYSARSIMAMDVQNYQILMKLTLSSCPWDISTVSHNTVVVTLNAEKKLVFITVGNSTLSIDRRLSVNGECWGVDYRHNKLAVSFLCPNQVQILNMQGSALYTFSMDHLGSAIFNKPYYLTYGNDDTTLYVSNFGNNSVVCLKLNGTIAATYTDKELLLPRQPVVTSNGDVLVCGQSTNTVHQITKDCKKVRMLLSQTDNLNRPQSICLIEENDMIYVGMHDQNHIKMFKIDQKPQ